MLNDAVSEDRLGSVVNKVYVKPWHYIPLSEQKILSLYYYLTLVCYSLGKGITIHWRRLSTVPSVKSWLFRARVVNHRAHTQQFSPLRSFCHLPLRMLDINKHVSFTQHTVACICKPSPSTTVKRWDPSQNMRHPLHHRSIVLTPTKQPQILISNTNVWTLACFVLANCSLACSKHYWGMTKRYHGLSLH